MVESLRNHEKQADIGNTNTTNNRIAVAASSSASSSSSSYTSDGTVAPVESVGWRFRGGMAEAKVPISGRHTPVHTKTARN